MLPVPPLVSFIGNTQNTFFPEPVSEPGYTLHLVFISLVSFYPEQFLSFSLTFMTLTFFDVYRLVVL